MFSFSDPTIQELIKFSLPTSGPKGPHVTRLAMYKALKDVLLAKDGSATRALSISHSESLGHVLGLRQTQYTEANYPDVNILSLPFEDSTFDFCISDQVFEHIEGDPFLAFKETARVVKHGGYLCHTSCFINPIHGQDFWRFTPGGLKLMAEAASCKTVSAAGWGNKDAWALVDAGFRYQGIPLDEDHPLYKIATQNDHGWPIVVWIVAQRLPPK